MVRLAKKRRHVKLATVAWLREGRITYTMPLMEVLLGMGAVMSEMVDVEPVGWGWPGIAVLETGQKSQWCSSERGASVSYEGCWLG